jgi:dolichol-phosphate mannosyltransferase
MDDAHLDFELILVDDGSTDGSFEEIKRLASMHTFIRGYKLSRNFGHQAALTVGLKESRGTEIAIIDDDLQDPPDLLPMFFDKLAKGADVVYGIRRKRKEGRIKRFLFILFYWLLKKMSHIDIPQDSGDFCAMKRRVRDAIVQLYDANPFIRGFRAWVGFKQIGVEYERAARETGESGYTMSKYVKLAVTGIIMFSNLPLRIATYIGLLVAAFSAIYALAIIGRWLLVARFDVPGFLSILVLVTFIGGVQLVSIGIIGEYVGRLMENTRRWPVAIVDETTMESSK